MAQRRTGMMAGMLLAGMAAGLAFLGCRDRYAEGKAEEARIAADLDGKTVLIREGLSSIATEAGSILARDTAAVTPLFPGREYVFYRDTIYYNPKDDGNGAMFYTGAVPVGPAQKARVLALEGLVPAQKAFVESGPAKGLVVQTYLITGDSLLVFYPFSDLLSYIPPKRDMKGRGVWKKMSVEANPGRGPQWDAPYVDTTGKGYMVDITCPVEIKGAMEAVAGADITLNALNKDLAGRSDLKLFLVERKNAQILAMSAAAESAFSLGNVEAFKYLRMIENAELIKDAVLPDNLVLTKTSSEPMRQLWAAIQGDQADFFVDLGGRKLRAHADYLRETGWALVLVE